MAHLARAEQILTLFGDILYEAKLIKQSYDEMEEI